MSILGNFKSLTPVQRNTFIASFLGWALDAFDFFILIFVMPAVAREFHRPISHIAFTITATLALRPVGALIFGWIADRYGRRIPLMIDVIFYSVVEVLSGLAPSYGWFLVMRALYGIGMGGEWGVGASLAMEAVAPRWRGFFSGLLQEGYAVGYLLAAAAFFFVFPHYGWRAMFFLGGAPALLTIYIRTKVPESEAWLAGRVSKHAEEHLGKDIATYLGSFLFLVLLMFAFNSFSHGSQALYPTFLQNNRRLFAGDGAQKVAIIYNLGALLGGILFGAWSEHIGRRKTIVIAALLTIPAVIPLWAFSHGPAVSLGGFAMNSWCKARGERSPRT